LKEKKVKKLFGHDKGGAVAFYGSEGKKRQHREML
jgi:hypothetical protein